MRRFHCCRINAKHFWALSAAVSTVITRATAASLRTVGIRRLAYCSVEALHGNAGRRTSGQCPPRFADAAQLLAQALATPGYPTQVCDPANRTAWEALGE